MAPRFGYARAENISRFVLRHLTSLVHADSLASPNVERNATEFQMSGRRGWLGVVESQPLTTHNKSSKETEAGQRRSNAGIPALGTNGDERGRTETTDRSQVSRVGLEPTTSGLTYRTGFHPPLPLRSGLYHLPRPNRWGAARKVSEDSGQGRPFLLIAQSGGLSRTRYLPDAYRRLSGCPSIWSSSTSGLTARALRS